MERCLRRIVPFEILIEIIDDAGIDKVNGSGETRNDSQNRLDQSGFADTIEPFQNNFLPVTHRKRHGRKQRRLVSDRKSADGQSRCGQKLNIREFEMCLQIVGRRIDSFKLIQTFLARFGHRRPRSGLVLSDIGLVLFDLASLFLIGFELHGLFFFFLPDCFPEAASIFCDLAKCNVDDRIGDSL